MTCVGVFAFVFGVNSSIHSYLVLKYAKEDKVRGRRSRLEALDRARLCPLL